MRGRLGEIAALFLRLGTTAFGGPAAHVALMRDEVVRRRRWVSDEEFLDLLGATNLIPGPNSTEMAIHLGHRRAGWPGLLVAGVSFILPAALITLVLAWAYVRYGSMPEVGWLLYGVKPAILAVVVQAIASLAPRAARTPSLLALGAAVLVIAALGGNEFLVLLAAGAACIALRALERRRGAPGAASLALLPAAAVTTAASAPAAAAPVGSAALFWPFFKIGSVLFGSGYVLLAFLQAELVERLGWLDQAQLLDAIAIGQMTPGPVFTTATFVGYLLGGTSGAVVATSGIFLPAFVFVALSAPLLPRLRTSWIASAFLDGVNVASLALMAVVTLQLLRAAVVDVPSAVIGLVALVLLLRHGVSSTWLVLGGALVGLVAGSLR
ncbi:MAG TPA: chromate efflux transporter [Candidatus Binatia bacterium]